MKLSRDEKKFLDRVCFRLFKNPLKWRQMLKEGMSHDEVMQELVNKTKETQRENKVRPKFNLSASNDETIREPHKRDPN